MSKAVVYRFMQQISRISQVPGPSGLGACPGLGALRATTAMPAGLFHTVKSRLEEVLAIPEASTLIAESKTKNLMQYYRTLIPDDKKIFLKTLATEYNIHQLAVIQLASQLTAAQDRGPAVLLKSEERLRHALIPKYQHLFTQVSRLEHGVKFLVDVRADILTILMSHGVDGDDAHLHAMNACLRDLLSLWFSVGFLHLERITWESPCDMLQKISEYEAVHPIRNWTDLKRRVGPYRRCFVFAHNSMPREPVVVLHTALTSEITNSIQTIVSDAGIPAVDNNGQSEESMDENQNNITTAIFYSITSTQKGLQGVELGNYLIKSVVRELLTEFPQMHQFSSLSPIPGFRDWLVGELNKYIHQYAAGESPDQLLFLSQELEQLSDLLSCKPKATFDSLRKVLLNHSWVSQPHLSRALEQPLTRLCARYLYKEKRRGFACNPVAHFHLRNGAEMWRVNWMADSTPRGLCAACGLMVNYRYFLHKTEENSRQYMSHQRIEASAQVLKLIGQLPEPTDDQDAEPTDTKPVITTR